MPSESVGTSCLHEAKCHFLCLWQPHVEFMGPPLKLHIAHEVLIC